MTSTRVVRPTDLVALVSFDGRVYPNEARTWDRLGCDPAAAPVLSSAVEQWFSFATGRHTWISIQGQTIRGLISARPRGTRNAWEIDCLIVAADSEHLALNLFDQVTAGAARSGTHKLFLRLDAGSELLVAARKAGFVPYTAEHLLRAGPPLPAEPLLPPGLALRPRERSDEFGLFQLYNRSAPAAVRMTEGVDLSEWKAAAERRGGGRGAADIVAEREGRIVAWLRTSRGECAGRLDLSLAPEEWPSVDALIAWGMRDLGDIRPVYAALPAYAQALIERLRAVGFTPAGEYALLAKRLTQLVRAARPVRATAKPIPTV